MQGPPLTHSEIVARLEREVERYEAMGLSHAQAVALTAGSHAANPGKVLALVPANRGAV